MEEELTAVQAAKLTGRSTRTIRRWIKEGKLAARPLARNRYAINYDDLIAITGPLPEPAPLTPEEKIEALEKRVTALERQFTGFTHQHMLLLENYVKLKTHPENGK